VTPDPTARPAGSAGSLELNRSSYRILDEFLTRQECVALLGHIDRYRRDHPLAEIHRPMKTRALRYQVIDGEQIREHLPSIWQLYTGRVQAAVNGSAATRYVPLSNTRAGVNVNIMRPEQSSYRWHYDRVRLTCLLYLNAVEGGETVMYPNFRLHLGSAGSPAAQRALDRLIQTSPIRKLFGRKVVTRPRAGRALVMRGDRCWHSVRPVTGNQERINIVLAYDYPGAQYPVDEALDAYLYTQQATRPADPNYG
jgi:hypothetical protein